MLSPFRMVCRDFILPEPASYVFFYAVFNLRNLLYLIKAAETVINEIVDEQRIDVDAVSGATNSSIVIKKAVENALKSGL